MVQFYPWFKFCFPLFLGMVMDMMNDNEYEAKENEVYTKDKIEHQHTTWFQTALNLVNTYF